MPITVTVAETPNPNARRFVLDRPIQEVSRGRSYTTEDEPDDPLASAVLQLDGVDGVMLLPSSVTVNKADGVDWEELQPVVLETLHAQFD